MNVRLGFCSYWYILYFSIMKKGKKTIKGESYKRRVLEINAIYDKYARSGLSNKALYMAYISHF